MIKQNQKANAAQYGKIGFSARLKKDLTRNKMLYIWAIPIILYYIIFMYLPMSGLVMAFQDYAPTLGISGSPGVGFKHFADFFSNAYFWRLIRNTVWISFCSIVFGFPMPLLLALLLNEVRSKKFMKTVQTITYMPHFISLVVMVGLLKDFLSVDGIIGSFFAAVTGNELSMLSYPKYFVPIYVASNVWQGAGWDSILYLAALAGIDTSLYEACEIDGGGRIRQLFTVTLHGILPTFITLLILRIGSILNVGSEKILLMYNEMTFETADVISTYIYRTGLQGMQWSPGVAIGMFNSAINVVFLVLANYISRKTTEVSLF